MGDVAVAGLHGRGTSSRARSTTSPGHGHHVPQPSPGGRLSRNRASPTSTQIKGQKISSGSAGSGTNFMSETVFKALGIPLDSYTDSRLTFTGTANALAGRDHRGGFHVVGRPGNQLHPGPWPPPGKSSMIGGHSRRRPRKFWPPISHLLGGGSWPGRDLHRAWTSGRVRPSASGTS